MRHFKPMFLISKNIFSKVQRNLLSHRFHVENKRFLTSLSVSRRNGLKSPAFQIIGKRLNSAAAAAMKTPAEEQMTMLCMQCEQTSHGTGCTTQGICGKVPETSNLQDLLLAVNNNIAQYMNQLGSHVPQDLRENVREHWLESIFSTLTNVNFDEERMIKYLEKSCQIRGALQTIYHNEGKKDDFEIEANTGGSFKFSKDIGYLLKEASNVSLITRKYQMQNIDCFGLRECAHYGIKGVAAYFSHAEGMRAENSSLYTDEERDAVYDKLFESAAKINDFKEDLNFYLNLCLSIGELNIKVLELLDRSHNKLFGTPEPTEVSCTPVPGKSILLSGHDILDVYHILKQTEGKNINIYTHGELLPAHSYPKLKKFPHLIGHFGSAWQNQVWEFREFPGPIVMTSNCLMPPRRRYRDRLYTLRSVGYENLKHINGSHNIDFNQVIQQALQLPGFNEETVAKWSGKKPFLTGFGHSAVLSNAETIVNAIKSGNLNHIFVIGGCDGTEKSRSYFTELARNTPDDSIILTLGCGKFRLTGLELGTLGNSGIPRLIDVGQCNDSYSAVVVALKLADALSVKVTDLPLHFAVSWFEQKAVAVFLSLLHLGMKNIRIGPSLPAFITPNVLEYLNKNLGVRQVNMEDEEQDLEEMLAGK